MTIPARLVVHDVSCPVTIHHISRFGAFIGDVRPLDGGTEVVLQLAVQQPHDLELEAVVSYWLDPETAARLDTRSGAGVRFRDPIDARDTAFSAAITCSLVEQTLVAGGRARARAQKSTLPTPEHILRQLVAATEVSKSGGSGRLALAGDLATLGIMDVLTELALLHMTGQLEVWHDGDTTTLDLVDGDIADVRSSYRACTRATLLYRLLSCTAGSFRVLAGQAHTSGAERTKVMHLLFDYLRMQEAT